MEIVEDWSARRNDVIAAARALAATWPARPFDNHNGITGPSAVALAYFLRRLAPTTVFEVGVWRGFSTWLIEQAVPQAKLFCLDPIFTVWPLLDPAKFGTTYKSPRADYHADDFSCIGLQVTPDRRDRLVVLFDDHQNKVIRLDQARRAGVKHLLFDDDVPYAADHETFAQMHLGKRLPPWFSQVVRRYERFPPLWEAVERDGMRHSALELPDLPELAPLKAERDKWSWLSYIELA